MVERGQHARFAREARSSIGIGCERQRQDLYRHVAAQLAVASAVDLPHAACANLLRQCVATERAADQAGDGVGAREEQRLDFLSQRVVIATRVAEKAGTVSGRLDERSEMQIGDLIGSRLRHRSGDWDVELYKQAVGGGPSDPSIVVFRLRLPISCTGQR